MTDSLTYVGGSVSCRSQRSVRAERKREAEKEGWNEERGNKEMENWDSRGMLSTQEDGGAFLDRGRLLLHVRREQAARKGSGHLTLGENISTERGRYCRIDV